MEPVGGGGASSAAVRYRAEAARAFQHYLDRATPHTAGRWAGTLLAAAVYALRVYYVQGFYVVSYGLGIYPLNLLIGFLSPMVDPELEALDQAGPVLPTRGNDEFKPFTRRLPEFKFWYAITKAFCVAFVMTFFSVFAAVPVGGAAATFGGATAAAPKGNLHQTLPHNSASKFCAPSPLFLNY